MGLLAPGVAQSLYPLPAPALPEIDLGAQVGNYLLKIGERTGQFCRHLEVP